MELFDFFDAFPLLGINRQEISETALVERKWKETGKTRMAVPATAATGLAQMPTKKMTERFANDIQLLQVN